MFKSTKPKWSKYKHAPFRIDLPKFQYDQEDAPIPADVLSCFPSDFDDNIWVIDRMDNCYKFTLATNQNGQVVITVVDLDKLKKIFKVKAIFKLELRYINWGVFYGIICNEYFIEVLGRKVDSLYIPNIIPLYNQIYSK
ncbi:hypothetical protein PIB30_057360 [Stylosanthes scabra]|uniref:LAGLIDADG homing endonuclease n=1 Tax=Stylosanthes scabra TaxID=79078 RepID=A0ABU6ZIB4_9FABA|nr:hypothetical protein [Stylosanthes scabra]